MKLYTFLRKLFVFSFVICVSFTNISCSLYENNTLGNYQLKTIKIDPEKVSDGLNLCQYRVDSICSLSFPNGMELHEITKLIVKNDRIYIMDSRLDRTIFVFDCSGKFLFKAGDRGRAKNEYIDGPADFFVDNDNNIHVFDNKAEKIIVFDHTGSVCNVIDVRLYYPYSFGMMPNKKYVYDFNFDKDEENTALAVCDENNIIKDKLLYRSEKYTFVPSSQTFFANANRLSHIPLLADSVIVFNNDTLEKVVKFDFDGKFIMKEAPSLVIDLHEPQEISAYQGVRALLSYQETDNLILLEYIYKSMTNYWLFNKCTKRSISGNFLFEGLSPFHNYYIRDNQIITIVCDESVSIDENDSNFDKKEYNANYEKSSEQIKDMYDGKTKLPAIVYFSIR